MQLIPSLIKNLKKYEILNKEETNDKKHNAKVDTVVIDEYKIDEIEK
jgi:hypothetical protein